MLCDVRGKRGGEGWGRDCRWEEGRVGKMLVRKGGGEEGGEKGEWGKD